MVQEKSVGAVIYFKKNFETKFLLLHYASGHWDFAKGHVEEKETEEETLWREIEEETGLTEKEAKVIPGFKERITYFYTREKETIFKEVIFYIVESKKEKIILSKEHTEFKWLPYSGALKKTTFDNAKNVLEKAEQFLNKKKHSP